MAASGFHVNSAAAGCCGGKLRLFILQVWPSLLVAQAHKHTSTTTNKGTTNLLSEVLPCPKRPPSPHITDFLLVQSSSWSSQCFSWASQPAFWPKTSSWSQLSFWSQTSFCSQMFSCSESSSTYQISSWSKTFSRPQALAEQ